MVTELFGGNLPFRATGAELKGLFGQGLKTLRSIRWNSKSTNTPHRIRLESAWADYSYLSPPLDRLPNCGEKQNTFAFSMRSEELRHIIIKKRKTGCSQALPIRCQVDFASNDGGFELGGAIATISEALDYWGQLGEAENIDTGIGRQLLS